MANDPDDAAAGRKQVATTDAWTMEGDCVISIGIMAVSDITLQFEWRLRLSIVYVGNSVSQCTEGVSFLINLFYTRWFPFFYF